ncbi:MAG: hypothetical protein K2J14_01150, partial [Treponemataceae bacterium]|nr:hypothetical protein [Treponemataceae bacterium]
PPPFRFWDLKNICSFAVFASGRAKNICLFLTFALGSEKTFVRSPLLRWADKKIFVCRAP